MLYSMHQQRQAELLSQLATLLESINAGTLPVTESLKLRHLVDCLCHPSAERERAFLDTSGVDETVKALISGSRRTLNAAAMLGIS